MQKQHALLTAFAELIDNHLIKTTLGKYYDTINASNVTQSHAYIESQQSVGKNDGM